MPGSIAFVSCRRLMGLRRVIESELREKGGRVLPPPSRKVDRLEAKGYPLQVDALHDIGMTELCTHTTPHHTIGKSCSGDT